jgi:hypothetical protein
MTSVRGRTAIASTLLHFHCWHQHPTPLRLAAGNQDHRNFNEFESASYFDGDPVMAEKKEVNKSTFLDHAAKCTT